MPSGRSHLCAASLASSSCVIAALVSIRGLRWQRVMIV
jgi:hypothetical protein